MKESDRNFEIVAKTLYGLEDILASEIAELGGIAIRKGNRIVKYQGNKELLYKSNIYLRTALRILKPVYNSKIRDQKEYYQKIKNINWQQFFNIHHTFAIDSVISSEHFKNSHYAAQVAKDAIADHFREKYSKRPSVSKNPDILINVHLSHNNLSISLDSSGEPLNKRGYRIHGGIAPINEVLAAAIIKTTGWKDEYPFYDLMCGSGTFGIEAAMMARNIVPGIIRKNYAFMHWNDFDLELLNGIKDQIKLNKLQSSVFCSDVSVDAIEIARRNAENALVRNDIKFSCNSFHEVKPESNKGVVVLNPPYGERFSDNSLIKLYQELGTFLKHNFSGFSVWIISSNLKAMDKIGLKATKKYKLFNGALQCQLNNYNIFDGKYRDYKKINSN